MSQYADNLFQRSGLSSASLGELARAKPLTFETSWPIAGLLPPGLTLCTGDSFSGKTSLALHLAYNLAHGTAPFTTIDETTHTIPRFRVHFLALDSSNLSLYQLQSHLPPPPSYDPDSRYLTLTNICELLTPSSPNNGLLHLRELLSTFGDLRLLVLDNLTSLRHLFNGTDRELLSILRRLAEQYNISILVLHTCKASTSLRSCADYHMHLTRLPIPQYSQLEINGKGFRSATYQLHLSPDPIAFRPITLQEISALNTIGARKTLTPERLVILRLLHDCSQDLTPKQISTLLDIDYDCTRQLLSKMVKASLLLTKARGHYTLHPFVKPFISSIIVQYPLLPSPSLEHIPPDDLAETTPPQTTIAHNRPIQSPPEKQISDHPTQPDSSQPLPHHQPSSQNAIAHNPSNQHQSPQPSNPHNQLPLNPQIPRNMPSPTTASTPNTSLNDPEPPKYVGAIFMSAIAPNTPLNSPEPPKHVGAQVSNNCSAIAHKSSNKDQPELPPDSTIAHNQPSQLPTTQLPPNPTHPPAYLTEPVDQIDITRIARDFLPGSNNLNIHLSPPDQP